MMAFTKPVSLVSANIGTSYESISGHLFFTTLKSFEISEPRVPRLDRLPNGRNRITTNEVIAKGG